MEWGVEWAGMRICLVNCLVVVVDSLEVEGQVDVSEILSEIALCNGPRECELELD